MAIASARPASASVPEAMPLTEAQAGLWYMQRLDPANPVLNTGQYIELRGPLDVAAFLEAVATMAEEAESLSLAFSDTPDGPRQWIDPARRPACDFRDLSARPDAREEALADMQADTGTPLDLSRDPLALFRLYRIGPDHYLWYERIHHLAIDGYGMVLITNRVGEIYSERVAGETPRPALAPFSRSIEEDAAYRLAERRETDAAYWREALTGMADVVGLKPGRAVTGHSWHRHTDALPRETTARLDAFCKQHGLSWPDVLTGLAGAYCRRFAGVAEMTVGVPFMGRLGNAAARTPCTLMNVPPLRLRAEEDMPLADMLRIVARDLTRTRRHGRYRSEQVRRELGMVGGQRRLFGPMINVQPFDMPPRFAGIEAQLHILGAGAVDDLTITFRGDARDGLPFEIDSNPHLYSPEETAAHARRLATFIDAALQAETLADVPLATPEEAERFSHAVNATAHVLPDTTLTALLEDAFRQNATAPALRFGGETLTYADLDRRSAALAAALAERGAGPDRLVAVALPRSFDLVVALIAIIRAGAAYLPLDPAHPPERLARILASAKPVCILADGGTATLFEDESLLPVSAWPSAAPASSRALPAPNDLAYVIYTSGSTGEPKGVAIEHRAIVNRLEWMRSHYGIDASDRILQKTPATFDVSVWEFFLPLIAGATLVIAPPEAHRDPEAIAGLIRAHGVSTLHFVPSMLSAFLAAPASEKLAVQRVFVSGEELTADLRDRFHARMNAELHNLYGPTEAAVDVSFWPASREDRSNPVPIGFPVWNTALHVLDSQMRPLPAGVAGDLYLGGVQLARGYLGRDDLTRERFIADPFTPGGRLYKTGDLARRREDGAVEFLGRSDHQVKIRGLRIELGEIEAAIAASGLVREAIVIAREDRPGDRRIVAYAVPAPGATEEALRRFASTRLPDYMVPSAFLMLESLPVTVNGKLDRAALPAPIAPMTGGTEPETESEAVLARLFGEALGSDTPVSADTDFFLAGGDSLLAVHLTLRIREHFGYDPGLGALFETPTVAALAARLDAGDGFAEAGLGPVIRLANGPAERPPLFLIHPAGGLAWGYRTLASALEPSRTVHGLQSPALDPEQPPPENLEALAHAYAEQVMAIAPEGPVHLAGWSVGGIIAQAMAAILQEKGRTIGLLALLDAYPCDCWRAEPEPDELAALKALLAIAGHDPADHPELASRDAILAFLKKGGSLIGRLPERALDGVVRAVLDTNRLVRRHYHRRFEGRLTHIRAALDHKDRDLTPDLWSAYAGELDCAAVPFLHAHMTSPGAARLIAPLLSERMAAFPGDFHATDRI